MKKVVIAIVLLSLLIGIAGCGGKEPEDTAFAEPNGAGTVIDGSNAETKEPEKTSGDALCGVYLNGGSVAEIKMGTYFEGAQTDSCTVKMPTEYMFGAIYTEESGQTHSISGTGSSTLQEALDEGRVNEADNAFSTVYLNSFAKDKSSLSFYIYTVDNLSMDDLKEVTPNGVEFGTDEHPAYYYVDTEVYADADLCIGYQVNDSILLSITYSGPLADELGLEQLAQNIYDLVEVTD